MALSPGYMLTFIQFYYAFLWISEKHSRLGFIKLYRLIISSCITQLSYSVMQTLINFISESDGGTTQLITCIMATSQIVIVELYIRYLDEVQITKNYIERDK